MTFKRVNSFTTEDAAKLARELPQLEDNVAAEFSSLRGEVLSRPQVVNFIATPTRNVIAILPDQQLSVDTSQAEATVVFPALDARNFGRIFFLIKRNSSPFDLKTACQDPAVLCNAVPFPILMSSGAVVFLCDSSGYYRR